MIAGNPLQALGSRGEEISEELDNVNIVLLVCTQRTAGNMHRCDDYAGASIEQLPNHKLISFPIANGRGPNRAAGIGIMLHYDFLQSMTLIDTHYGTKMLQGRAGAPGCSSGILDYTFGGLDLPPVQSLKPKSTTRI